MSSPLPVECLEGDIAILGRKGGGKTYTSKGIVEHLLDLGRRVLILDPLGVWAGLRSAANGTDPGYRVAIFGGVHADLPLNTAAAAAMADVLARENVPAVVDLSDLSKSAQQSFLLAFLHELRRVNQEAMTLVLEEADVFAPQNPQGDDSKALHGEIDWIARRGRFKGFRLITICQRPARLSKDVLTQAATLIVHRLPSPQDRDAVKAWVEGNGDRDKAREVFDTLATLPVGEGWIWASESGLLAREKFPKIKTLDTSATPKAGEKRVEPKTLADVDLSAIRTALAVAEEATQPKPKNVAICQPDNQEIAAAEQRGFEQGSAEGHSRGYAEGYRAAMDGALAHFREACRAYGDLIGSAPELSEIRRTLEIHRSRSETKPEKDRAAPKTKAQNDLSGPQAQMLCALAWWKAMGNAQPTRAQVASIAGWRITSGHLRNVAGALRTAGMIDYPAEGRLALTAAGERVAPEPDTGSNVIDGIRATLTGPQTIIFDILLKCRRGLPREELAERAGWASTSGHLRNVVGSLSTLEVVTYPSQGVVALAPWILDAPHSDR